jgi:hypothetical protein
MTHVMLRNFKNLFDRVIHISCFIININIYKYRINLVNLIFLNICKLDTIGSSHRVEHNGETEFKMDTI